MSELSNAKLNEVDKPLIITFDTVNGGKMDCTVLTAFKSEGRDYVALMPNDDSRQIQLFRYSIKEEQNKEEGIILKDILSDMEFDAALKVFQSLVIEEDVE